MFSRALSGSSGGSSGEVLDIASDTYTIAETISIDNGAITVIGTANGTLAILVKVENGSATIIRDAWNAASYSNGTLTINLTLTAAYGKPRLVGCKY